MSSRTLAVLVGSLAWSVFAQPPDPSKDLERRNQSLSSLESLTPLCFSPDGRTLLLARFDPFKDTEAVLWDVEQGKSRRHFNWTGITGATISPDGRMALADDEGRLTLRDAEGRLQRTPIRGLLFTYPVVFSRDGKLLAGNQDGVLKVWDVATWKEQMAFPYEEGCHPLHYWFSADGKEFGAGFLYGSIRIWDTATGKTRSYFPTDKENEVYIRSLSPDLKAAIVQERMGKRNRTGTVWLWDLSTGKKRTLLERDKDAARAVDLVSADFSQDGTTLALGLEYHKGGTEVTIWEVKTGRKVRSLPGYRSAVLSADGKLLAVQNEKDMVSLKRLP